MNTLFIVSAIVIPLPVAAVLVFLIDLYGDEYTD